jgi:hypothetical protein
LGELWIFGFYEAIFGEVMEDGGGWQLVELQEAASWRFLWFSGTLKVCVVVDENRRARTVSPRPNISSR